ncbi:hypothetical protein KC220_24125, partial [Mycobacterium tuberculosis]|nr:hypothetical protein [Mycobacterium tuberculosis]
GQEQHLGRAGKPAVDCHMVKGTKLNVAHNISQAVQRELIISSVNINIETNDLIYVQAQLSL